MVVCFCVYVNSLQRVETEPPKNTFLSYKFVRFYLLILSLFHIFTSSYVPTPNDQLDHLPGGEKLKAGEN